ncbi:hypothetical protein BJ742DRAFT_772748 [Cladochytrium replicatum]|nr:hypothetical protein BJ742DRAFT_772748 [Cladochytrium replicatum]
MRGGTQRFYRAGSCAGVPDFENPHPRQVPLIGNDMFIALSDSKSNFAQRNANGVVRIYAAHSVLEDWHKTSDLATATDANAQKELLLEFYDGWFTSLRQLTSTFAPLPSRVVSYGGIPINTAGEVSGHMTTQKGGPWDTYYEYLLERLRSQIDQSDESDVSQGGDRTGCDNASIPFWDSGLDRAVTNAGVTTERVLVRRDLRTWIVL